MQELKMFVSAENTLGVVRDHVNAKNQPAPVMVRGCETVLKIRLFANSYDTTPYPVSLLSGIYDWKFVMDADYAENTDYILVADHANITVAEATDTDPNGNEVTYTEVSVPIPNTNTTELAAWLGTKSGVTGLHSELIGYDESGEQVFVLQIENFTVRNRIYRLAEPTPSGGTE